GAQQLLFRTDLHPDFSHCAAMLRRKGRRRFGVDLGPVALRDVLVDQGGLGDKHGWRPWAIFGLLWGVAALNSTSLLSFLPASGLWAWYRRSQRGKSSLGGIVLAAVLFLACNAPWVVRNYNVFGK